MSSQHQSFLRFTHATSDHISLAELSDRAFRTAMRLAGWCSLWNRAGRVPASIIQGVSRQQVRAWKAVLTELTQARHYAPPVLVLDGDEYQLNPAIFRFQRDESDWDRSEAPLVLARDGSVCRYCGTECSDDITIDHVFPRSRGGSDKLQNLAVACRSCNSRKNDRTPAEADMPLLPVPKAARA